MTDRVFITGVGLVTSTADTFDQLPASIVSMSSGVRPIFELERLRSRLGARVGDSAIASMANRELLDPEDDRCLLIALAAARQIPLDDLRSETDLVFSVGLAGGEMTRIRHGYEMVSRKEITPGKLLLRTAASVASAMAVRLGLQQGRLSVYQNACSAGLTAIGAAGDILRSGEADIAIAGGAESLDIAMQLGFDGIRALSPEACRPFDEHRSGVVLGEGACFLLLESQTHARARGAPVYAEYCGHGLSNDAFHRTRPDPTGAGQAQAMNEALKDAGVSRDQIDLVYAHGTGTKANDPAELAAISTVLGPKAAKVPIVSVKGAIGHTIAASGPINLGYAITGVRTGLISANVGLREAMQPYSEWRLPLEYLSEGPRYALINAFAFGGNNTSLVIRRWDEQDGR